MQVAKTVRMNEHFSKQLELTALAKGQLGTFCWIIRPELYDALMLDAFNPEACEKMMCRDQISVGWDGRVYDCDFNQVEELPCIGPEGELTIFDLAAGKVEGIKRPIRFGNHCYACTAGAGSSCGGTLVQGE